MDIVPEDDEIEDNRDAAQSKYVLIGSELEQYGPTYDDFNDNEPADVVRFCSA